MSGLKYGAYLGVFSRLTPELLERSKEEGFDFVEISVGDHANFDINEIKAAAKSLGLFILISTGCPVDKDPIGETEEVRKRGVEYLKNLIRIASELGAYSINGYTYSGNWHNKPKSLDFRQYWEWGVTNLREACRYAFDFGVGINVEAINRYETFLLTTLDRAVDFVKQVDMPNIKVHIDTFHMMTEETDFYNTILRTLPYASHFHLAESTRGYSRQRISAMGGCIQSLT